MRAVDTDILIAGGGPAGAACGALLARAGRRVVVLEEKQFPREKVCGECLSGAAIEPLRALDEASMLDGCAGQLTRMRVRAPYAAWDASLDALPPWSLTRGELDDRLRKRALAQGVDFRLGWRVRRVVVEGGVVRGVEAGPIEDLDSPTPIRAHVVIAADGRNSRVVRQTGRIVEQHGAPLLGFKRHLRFPDWPASTLDMFSLPGGYVGVCSLPGGGINVCGVAPYGAVRSQEGGLGAKLRAWSQLQPALLPLLVDESGEWLTTPNVRRQRAEPELPGVVYLGDALRTVAPLAGQGMTMALISACELAQRLSIRADASPQFQRDWAAWSRQKFDALCRRADALDWLLKRPRLLSGLRLGSALAPTLAAKVVARAYASTLPAHERPSVAAALLRCGLSASSRET